MVRKNYTPDFGKFKDSVRVTKEDEDKVVGFGFADSNGTELIADISDNKSVSYKHIGTSPQGEETTLNACKILIKILNEEGGDWIEPTNSTEGGVDCISSCRNDKNRQLRVQVVRANIEQKYWMTLNKLKNVTDVKTYEEISNNIKHAIDLKIAKIPYNIRKRLVLILDATVLPESCMNGVIEHFRDNLKDYISSIDFEQVWLVGPNAKMTYKIR